jgi:hypothetical protein
MDNAWVRRSGAGLAAVIATAVLRVLLVAAPAMAAPSATSLVASPDLSTVALGDSQTISATLTDTGSTLPVGGETLRVEQAASNSGPWSLTDLVTTDVTTGVGTYDVLPTATTYYRFVFQGTGAHAAATSNVLTVRVSPFATTLTAAPVASTVNIGDSVTIHATLIDANALPVDGETVRVEQAASNSGPWTLVNYADNEGGNGVYSLELYPTATAYYRFVYAPDPVGTYLGSTSNVLTVTIRLVPTSLTASPAETTVTIGAGATLSGVLMNTDDTVPLGGQAVRVEQAASDSGPWSPAGVVTSDVTTGAVTFSVIPTQTTYYRFVFEATDTYAASQSGALTVKVMPVLGTPTCPKSIKKNKSFTVQGTVQPGAPGGPAVKIQAYRKHNGSWSKYKSAYATTLSGTKYSVKVKINAKGKFKFNATITTSSQFVGVTTGYSKVMTVK